MAYTCGYFSSLALIYTPSIVPASYQKISGMAASIALMLACYFLACPNNDNGMPVGKTENFRNYLPKLDRYLPCFVDASHTPIVKMGSRRRLHPGSYLRNR
ncbi:hypothetical protein ANCDUO_03170 [Ancylostoma duodenale]|uniref:Uncharacterized protein n=1 Tax=Ancylostoma duodenale TaxID=51022 RepID=A0A0C2HAJ5_9BILA|nr:hypothetical protein ANCDUO_03170 [Ancylostoma duodenale]